MLADIALAFRNPAFVALVSGALFITTGYATTIASTNYMMLYVWQMSDAQLAWYPAGLAIAVFGAFAAVGHAHRRFGKRNTAIGAALASGAIAFLPYEIGRGSCRERGCQYVWIWVVAVSLKKKQNKQTKT